MLGQASAGHFPLKVLYFYKYLVEHGEQDGMPQIDRDLFFYCECQKFKVNLLMIMNMNLYISTYYNTCSITITCYLFNKLYINVTKTFTPNEQNLARTLPPNEPDILIDPSWVQYTGHSCILTMVSIISLGC